MRLGPIILDIRIRVPETTHGGAQIPLEIVAGPIILEDIQILALETIPGGDQMKHFITIQTAQAH